MTASSAWVWRTTVSLLPEARAASTSASSARVRRGSSARVFSSGSSASCWRTGAQPGDAESLVGDDLRGPRQTLWIGQHALVSVRGLAPVLAPVEEIAQISARGERRRGGRRRGTLRARGGAKGLERSPLVAGRLAGPPEPVEAPRAFRRWFPLGAAGQELRQGKQPREVTAPQLDLRQLLDEVGPRAVELQDLRVELRRLRLVVERGGADLAASPRMRVLSPTSVTTAAARPRSCRAFNQSFRSR